jgi:hypothetical protein
VCHIRGRCVLRRSSSHLFVNLLASVTAITFCSFSERNATPCDVTVMFVTDITRQIITLALSEVQPCHWLVGQTLQYAGLGGASLTSCKSPKYAYVTKKKAPPTAASGAVGQTWRPVEPTSRPNTFCHKRKLRDVMAITFCQAGVNELAAVARRPQTAKPPAIRSLTALPCCPSGVACDDRHIVLPGSVLCYCCTVRPRRCLDYYLLVELRAAEWRPSLFRMMEVIHKSVMSRLELVFAVFSR